MMAGWWQGAPGDMHAVGGRACCTPAGQWAWCPVCPHDSATGNLVLPPVVVVPCVPACLRDCVTAQVWLRCVSLYVAVLCVTALGYMCWPRTPLTCCWARTSNHTTRHIHPSLHPPSLRLYGSLPGVLTKLDIMDRGTNALPALANLVVPLRLGYVAIVNRSQADINSNKSMAEARA